MQPMDLSTIDWSKLGEPREVSAGLRVDRSHYGAACAGDPPGHPSYFQLAVYYGHSGNPPKYGPQYVMETEPGGTTYWTGWYEPGQGDYFTAPLEAAYIPPPLDSPRVKQWIWRTYQHGGRCWVDPDIPTNERRNIQRLLMPGVYREHKERVEALGGVRSVWYAPTYDVQNYYPKFEPSERLLRWSLTHRLRLFQADWWERYATRPRPEDCPGHLGTSHATGMSRDNGCRMCGRRVRD